MTAVHLVFPPVWPTETPYLSLPALAAYLRNRTDATVRALDLNIAFWTDLRSELNLERVWGWAGARLKQATQPHCTAELDLVIKLSKVARTRLSEFMARVRTGSVPMEEIDPLICLHFREESLGEWEPPKPVLHDHGYYDPDPLSDAIGLSEAATSADGILAALAHRGQANPYLEILPRLYDRACEGHRPDIVGISLTGVSQVVPAFALARWLKESLPTTLVVIGGAWITHVLDHADALLPLFDLADAFVAGPGEQPLTEIVRRISAGGGLDGIPGVFTSSGRSVSSKAGARWEAPLDELPTPDFGDLPLDSYRYPGLLPLQASRGCSWGRCTFCSYVTLDPHYTARMVERVVADIAVLVARHGAREIAFTDSLMEPPYFARLADELHRSRLPVRWRGFARFDRRYSSEVFHSMSLAGCHLIIWGMESASSRILKLARKGNTLAIIHENLRAAAAAGIHNRVCLIYGFPGESPEDHDATTTFIRERKDWIHSVAFCQYTAVRNTPMTRNPEAYGLVLEAVPAPLALEIGQSGLSSEYLAETDHILRRLALEVARHHMRPAATHGGRGDRLHHHSGFPMGDVR